MSNVQSTAARHYTSPASTIIKQLWASTELPEFALRDAMVWLEWDQILDENVHELYRFAQQHDIWEQDPEVMAELATEVRAEVEREWQAELLTKPPERPIYTKEQIAYVYSVDTRPKPKTDAEKLERKGEHVAQVRQLFPATPACEALAGKVRSAPAASAIVPEDEWMKFLHHDMRDRLTKDVGNVTLILKNSPHFRGCLMFDSMSYEISWHTAPEHEVGLKPPVAGETVADHHIAYVQHVLVTQYGLSVGKEIVWSAIESAAHERTVHPVQDYFAGLQWDGVKRVDKWLHTYLSAEDNEYNNSVGKWWLISAVARAQRPGCQADHVLILEGKQGKGKSQAIKSLANPWVSDSLPDLRDHAKAIEAISGQWIVEIAELDALKGASMTRVKSFVTQQVDKYRAPYAHSPVKRPRSCVFIGSTNDSTYLSDPTGARRFWPVNLVGRILQKQIREDRDQLWAEAQVMFDRGDQWHPTEEMLEAIEEQQEARRERHPWEEKVTEYVDGRDEITTDEIFSECLDIANVKDRSPKQGSDLANIMRGIGYAETKVTVGLKKRRGWKKLTG